MTNERVVELLKIERECINRDCDRQCLHCDLVQEQDDLNEMYNIVISRLDNGESHGYDTDNKYVNVEDVLETIRDMAHHPGHIFVAEDLIEELEWRLMKH